MAGYGSPMKPDRGRRWIWLVLSLAAYLALAMGASPARAFHPFPVADGASEHRRISDAALACGGPDTSACWSRTALDRLEVSLKRPDITAITFRNAAHCDGGDLAPDGATGRGRGPAALSACRDWIRENLKLARAAADGLVDARGAPVRDMQGCAWRVLRPRTPLCEVDFHLGRALHAAQDFYAHTNWVDRVPPGSTASLHNPPGLDGAGPSPWLAPGNTDAPPPGLMSGCFVFFPEGAFCHGRTRHQDLNKDRRADATLPPLGKTPRGAVEGNFARAFEAAAGETDRMWSDFQSALVADYGPVRGRAMACVLRGLPPSLCGSALPAGSPATPGASS